MAYDMEPIIHPRHNLVRQMLWEEERNKCPHDMGKCGGNIILTGIADAKNLVCDKIAILACTNGHKWMSPVID
ncbi:MAG: hypothetical protein A3G49_05160 [Candidatus Sungbacteria bacterium RIFCSPLOWO2_12_FULL_41_11]|uniref:Uncharacterized protein n=1 Tax=Candidatus Sungbacteria bacterium RIFCSPLOWO2_12_FULL_41_11 TaxID=1802286 RepID=A0A1G2LTU4_9BACT|nr:MAG: hypothetical protein UV01_C0003G0029 [Parcubacteria group bacterium GW2011_GWA2_42_14]OGZ98607.1 MAG: hypothetical protein A3D41_05295 [Candidatus Sungbacteria bacterium RIFCSPHIGHO2_02_FULL_41_12b]OHA14279.1 MAG: hypothetical protein A3G49_05160 [Candidatus Sungbacteria bacterium RIFCSPLOWO2_12_FULL_41_11]